MQNREIILRVRSPEGQYRITVMSRDTYGELLLQLSKKLNYSIKDLVVNKDDNRPLGLREGIKIGEVPYFQDGAVLKVETKAPKKPPLHKGISVAEIENETASSKCNHPPGGKCLNCLSVGSEKKKDSKQDESKPKCNHGPSGKCLNCTTDVNLKDRKGAAKMLCQHGPNAKCVHCLDVQFISDAAHISFDNWLQERKLKCKGVHPPQVKCNNCLPPSRQRYQVDQTCKLHEPYPKGMCNKCVPPNVVVKRQEYRHVDYVQFMNVAQIQEFVRNWLPKSHEQQRVAYLYGYYAEDPHYKGGIRVIVEAIYEPKQKGTYGGFQILESEEDAHVQAVVSGLTLERVGWLFTENNHDVVMSEKLIRMAAQFQENYRVPHESGYDISNFISVILRPDKEQPENVMPEVYMISDQGQALEKANLFVDSGSRRKMQVRVKEKSTDAYPSFIVGGKGATEFEPEFLLVKIAHGTSNNNKFAIIKKADFPVLTRSHPTKKDLKEYMRKNRNVKQSWLKYGDFNLLLYLSHEIDPQTVHKIAECVANEEQVGDFIDQMIEHRADL